MNVLKMMMANTTVGPDPIKVDGESYNCTIVGSGDISHFGISDDFSSKIYLKCTQDKA